MMQELSMLEIDEVSGAKASEGMSAVSGILWGAAVVAELIPGGQAVGAFLGLGAGIVAAGAGLAYLTGN
ncbi:hypothetical protein [Undibacterium sp. Xuan67W]|uniref:hypothetical protein n=1 Tax=Undibacterium sp. Xuan67W TaxID=3413057 RepID=UPI003BF42B67